MASETGTAPVKVTPNKDAVARIAAAKGWDLRELKSVPLYRERVVLKVGTKVSAKTFRVADDVIRCDGASFEDCYGKILERLAARGIEVL